MNTLRHAIAATGAVATLSAAAIVAVVTTAGPADAATSSPKVPVQGCCERTRLVPGQELVPEGPTGTTFLAATGLPPSEPAGSVYGQTETGFTLLLQNGNLVETLIDADGVTRPVWSVGTTTATRLVFQTDHNVVLRDAAGRALWATGTAGSTAAYFSPYGNGQIVTQDASGRVLSATGPAVTTLPGVVVQGAASPGRNYTLTVQSDGNLVEYDIRDRAHPRAVWSTRTAGAGRVRLTAQADGNLVLRNIDTGRAVWASGAKGGSAYYQLDVQEDRNVVLYRTDGVHRSTAVWSTHTAV